MNNGFFGYPAGSVYPVQVDVAFNCVVASNSTGTPALLVDGNDTTLYIGGGVVVSAMWVSFDLGTKRTVRRWRLLQLATSDGHFMNQYKWQWSSDLSTWHDITTHTAIAADETGIFPVPVTARYFRLVGLLDSNNSGAGWEGYTVSLLGY